MDNNSQCNSAFITGLQESGNLSDLSSRLVCHFPLEWNADTFEQRYSRLKTITTILKLCLMRTMSG